MDMESVETREETAYYEWGTTKDDDDSDDKSHDELRRRQDITQAPNTPAGDMTFEGMFIRTISLHLFIDLIARILMYVS